MLFAFLLLATAYAADLTLTVTCGTDCSNGYEVNGLINPTIHCNIGDTLRFVVTVPAHPLYIKTSATLGTTALWSATSNNGQESGTIVLSCTAAAKVQKELYYQDSTSLSAGGKICVGDACGAELCTDSVCWGATPPGATATPDQLSTYISSLAPDFAWYIENYASVSAFSWTSDWTQYNGLWAVQFSFVRTTIQATVTQQIIAAISDITGAPATTFGIVVIFDGALSADSTAYIYIGDPQSNEQLGGDIDVLFFAGANESPQCNIHDNCGRYSCYSYRNLIGEYSGDNNIQEGQCVQNIDPAWGYNQFRINADRTGGTYSTQCDSLCLFCAYEGTFVGDQCVCMSGSFTVYNCFSVKYASSSVLIPSLGVILALVVSLASL